MRRAAAVALATGLAVLAAAPALGWLTTSPAPAGPSASPDQRTAEPWADVSTLLDAIEARANVAPEAAPPVAAPAPSSPADRALAPPPRRSRSVATSAPAQPAGEGKSGLWAVVVGIDDYAGTSSDLRSAKADAYEVLALLDAVGVPLQQRYVLMDGEASAGSIVAGLDWLVQSTGPDATALVFYAGHVSKLGPGREAIVAADGANLTDLQVAERLRALRAHRTWLMFASCYGAGFDEALAEGRILTGAAGADDLAYENPRMGRSYLVEYMVRRAMNQHGIRTVEGAFAWAENELRRDNPDRIPVQLDRYAGDMPVENRPPKEAAPCPISLGTLVTCPRDD